MEQNSDPSIFETYFKIDICFNLSGNKFYSGFLLKQMATMLSYIIVLEGYEHH